MPQMKTRTIFAPAAADDIRERMQRLTPDARALWGRMTAAQMVCHLIDGFRIPLREMPVNPKRSPLWIGPVRWLFVHQLPWPKGKIPTRPEFTRTQAESWDADQAVWSAALHRFVERGRGSRAFGPHPGFGPMSTEEWGRLVYKHSDYHLRQFGV